MFKLIAVQAIALLLASCLSVIQVTVQLPEIKNPFSHGKNNRRAYDQVNEYLVRESVSINDVDSNLEKAISWLDSKVSSESSLTPKSFAGALRQLNDLRTLKREPRCDLVSMQIAKENDGAVRGFASRNSNAVRASRPIDQIVREYLEEHAKNCFNTYKVKLEEKNSLLRGFQDNVERLKSVETFAFGVLYANLYYEMGRQNSSWRNPWKPSNREEIKDLMVSLLSRNSSPVELKHALHLPYRLDDFVGALKYLAKDDPEVNHVGHTIEVEDKKLHDKVNKRIFQEYILEPCKFYVDEFKSIFQPASCDSQFEDVSDSEFKTRVMSSLDFFIEDSTMAFCWQTISKQGEIIDYLYQVAQKAKEEKFTGKRTFLEPVDEGYRLLPYTDD